jgi:hypothetical protein
VKAHGRHPIKTFIMPGALLLAGMYLEHRGAFAPYTNIAFDAFQHFKRARSEPSFQPEVTIFSVAEDTFRRFLNGSELHRQEQLAAVIRTIACGSPAVLGVDWNTADWQPEVVQQLANHVKDTRIVWARLLKSESGKSGNEEPTIPAPLLGGFSLPDNWLPGIAILSSDSDHNVRSYRRWHSVRAVEGASFEKKRSFSLEVTRSYCQAKPGASD